MLEDEARVGGVEGAPLVPVERRRLGGSEAELHPVRLAVGLGLAARRLELRRIPLDADDPASGSDLAGHGAGELAETAADIQHPVPRLESQRADRPGVEQPVEQRQAHLLLGV